MKILLPYTESKNTFVIFKSFLFWGSCLYICRCKGLYTEIPYTFYPVSLTVTSCSLQFINLTQTMWSHFEFFHFCHFQEFKMSESPCECSWIKGIAPNISSYRSDYQTNYILILSFKKHCSFKKAKNGILLIDIGFFSYISERQFLKYVDGRTAIFLFGALNRDSSMPVWVSVSWTRKLLARYSC